MKCFCGANMEKRLLKNGIFYECMCCGFLKKTGLPDEQAQKTRYDSHICDEGYIKYMENVYNTIKPYLVGNTILDYGCGKQHTLHNILLENGYNSNYYDLFYYPDTIFDLYDSIVLIEVFEHIEDPIKELEKITGYLKSKGRIIIMTKEKPEHYENWWYLRDSTHVSFFTHQAFLEIASILGMKLIYSKEDSLFILERIN